MNKLLVKFEREPSLKYNLSPTCSLILSKDERQVRKLRKYHESPLPLLSSISVFRSTIGSYNEELLEYGLSSRLKVGDQSSESLVGSNIYLILTDTLTFQGNSYLKNQYKRLRKYRTEGDYNSYWHLSWTLMCKSWSFKLASLLSWQSRWYKELSLHSFHGLWKGLHKILTLRDKSPNLKNLWIESPAGKFRQLCIPNKAWRLYFHMLNNFLSYLYSPKLSKSEYDGFLYGRGCLSWWKGVLWGDYLKYPNILEIDFSSAFPNLNRRYLYKCLKRDGLLPINFIHLLLTHLPSRSQESSTFPTLESFIENTTNTLWRNSTRNLPMGIGVCPLLFVICLKSALEEVNLRIPGIKYRFYCDDGSIFYTYRGLLTYIWNSNITFLTLIKHLLSRRSLLVELLNNHPTFKEAGLIICTKKSRLVKSLGVWHYPYISLGLKLETLIPKWQQFFNYLLRQPTPLELSGWTRGRGANPIKKKESTLPSRVPLNHLNPGSVRQLNIDLLLSKYEKYFGLIQSKLYCNLNKLYTIKTYPESKKKSILSKIQYSLKGDNNFNKKQFVQKIDIFNASSIISELFLQCQTKTSLAMNWKIVRPNLERELTIPWIRIDNNPFNSSIKNPLPPLSNIERERLDKFHKYSELNLTPTEINKYKQLYEQTKEPPL
jgi:Reverse transcriptase (RNA-dependent DNA polymerase)